MSRPLKIVHVLSQLQPTGAEFCAVELAERQKALGHQVWIISDNLFAPTDIEYISQPMGNRRYFQRFRNVSFLKKWVIDNKIDVVHAHSRAASWVCHYALKKLKVPLVSSIHGRQHIHRSSKRKNIYGQRILPVCENIKLHLVEELGLPKDKIFVCQNGFSFADDQNTIREKNNGDQFVVSIVGRTTGPKGEKTACLLRQVLPKVFEQFAGSIKVRIIGGELKNLGDKGMEAFLNLQNSFPGQIESLGFVSDLSEKLKESDLVLASGRVAIEALSLKIPVIAMGEARAEGLVTPENLNDCFWSNFGDVSKTQSSPDMNFDSILSEILKAVDGEKLDQELLSKKVRGFYAHKNMVDITMEAYGQALGDKLFPNHIPILMYHKVPSAPIPSKHKTFITKSNLKKHFNFFKLTGKTPITFLDYLGFIDRGPWSRVNVPKHPVILTFDDGYQDNVDNLLPLVKDFKYPVVLYPLCDKGVQDNYWDLKKDSGEPRCLLMGVDGILEFSKEGCEIGSHGFRHLNLVELEVAGKQEELLREIRDSKRKLEELTGKPVVSFAYPFGKSNLTVRNMVREAGYLFGVSTDSGALRLESDRFFVFRVNVFPGDGIFGIWKKTSTWYRDRFFRKKGR